MTSVPVRSNRTFVLIALAVALFYFAYHVMSFTALNIDLTVYAMVGRAIYRDGVLPYGEVFDHKPFLTYFIYGLLAYNPLETNIFALFGLLCTFLTSVFARRLLLARQVALPAVFLAMFVAAHQRAVQQSANTEVLLVLLAFIAVGLLLRPGQQKSDFLFSAIAAVSAININYIAGLFLMPAMLFALFIRSAGGSKFVRSAFLMLGLSMLIWATALALLATAGMDVAEYFRLQYMFLTGYNDEVHPIRSTFVVVSCVCAVVAIAPFLQWSPIRPEARNAAVAMSFLIFAGLMSFVVNGKYFLHYLYLVTAPTAVILLSFDWQTSWRRFVPMIALALTVIGYAGVTLILHKFYQYPPTLYEQYRPLTDKVRGTTVMPMRASARIVYYSEARISQPMVFFHHAYLVYGDGEDDYYLSHFDDEHDYVITGYGWCDKDGRGWRSCARLAQDYTEVLSLPSDYPHDGFQLYERRGDGQ